MTYFTMKGKEGKGKERKRGGRFPRGLGLVYQRID
jgi:hypothetical protein